MGNAFLEKELEDYVATDPGMLVECAQGSRNGGYKLLGTQIPCVTGVIDMLFCRRNGLYLVEFKAECATEKTIGQVIRYREVIQHLNLFDYIPTDEEWLKVYPLLPEVPVGCFIVAPSFSKDCLKALRYIGYGIVADKNDSGYFNLNAVDYYPRGDNYKLAQAVSGFMVSFCNYYKGKLEGGSYEQR